MEKYYIVIEDQQKGPYTLEELKEQEISSSLLVWNESMEDWTEARNVSELKDIFQKNSTTYTQKI